MTKKSEVYVSYLYACIRCKSITVYFKNKKEEGGAYITVSEETLPCKYVSKNNKTKLRQKKKDEIKG